MRRITQSSFARCFVSRCEITPSPFHAHRLVTVQYIWCAMARWREAPLVVCLATLMGQAGETMSSSCLKGVDDFKCCVFLSVLVMAVWPHS
mmetsp:Transcript_22440/g.68381  ORF Transcript_22440/g.68381 Transcript_22440/m.68381 type:complete len:91 (+) Transcript_22440:2122-2394(+)